MAEDQVWGASSVQDSIWGKSGTCRWPQVLAPKAFRFQAGQTPKEWNHCWRLESSKTQQFGECGVPSPSGETWARSQEGESVCMKPTVFCSMTAQSRLSPAPHARSCPCHFRTVPEFIRATSQTAQASRSGWLRPNRRGGQSYARVPLSGPALLQYFLRLRSPATLYSRLDQPLGIGGCPSHGIR